MGPPVGVPPGERTGGKVAPGAVGDWRLTGLDPEGADLACGDDIRRLEFMTPVADAAALRAALVALARRAV